MEEEDLKIKKENFHSENPSVKSSNTNCESELNTDSTLAIDFESIQEKSQKKARISYTHSQKLEIVNHWLQAKKSDEKLTMAEFALQYGWKSKSVLCRWIQELGMDSSKKIAPKDIDNVDQKNVKIKQELSESDFDIATSFLEKDSNQENLANLCETKIEEQDNNRA